MAKKTYSIVTNGRRCYFSLHGDSIRWLEADQCEGCGAAMDDIDDGANLAGKNPLVLRCGRCNSLYPTRAS